MYTTNLPAAQESWGLVAEHERVIAQFEDAWQHGQRPSIDEYLPAGEPMTRTLLIELVHSDLECRLKVGETVRVENYLERYPALAEEPGVINELIVSEYRLRRPREANVTVQEYLSRFPQYQAELLARLQDCPRRPIPTTVGSLTPTPVPPADPNGPSIPGYEIQGELGRGGMGVVYKARQVALKRLVALKMILAGSHATAESLARFRAEAQAVAQLQHPNIVQVYEIGEQDGLPYFSLEFVDGGSLKQSLAGAPQAAVPAAQFLETLARAVHAAHQAGIVHRDLKPENILLAVSHQPSAARDNHAVTPPRLSAENCLLSATPKISDFGLAKRLDEVGLTRTGEVMGTPSYMAPEQVLGRVADIGPATDVWALGAILYELLTGQPPFRGPTVFDTLDQVREQEPVQPRRLQPKVPRDLETICLKCLHKDRARRYASALALAEDLRRFLNREPIRARPTSAAERLGKWVRRRPAEAAFTALVLASGLALVGLFVWHSIDLREQLKEARDSERAAQLALRRTELKLEVGELFAQARAALDRQDWPAAGRRIDTVVEKVAAEPLLADLAEVADQLRRELDRYRQDREAFTQVFRPQRDDALFYQTLFTGLDAEANRQKTRDAVALALRVFDVVPEAAAPPAINRSHFKPFEVEEICEGCYQLLLVLAETEVEPRAAAAPARALRILDQAARLRPPTQAYHLRRARYLEQVGDRAGATAERRRALAVPPAGALDAFLSGEEHFRAGDLAQAERAFHRALRLQPDHFWARYFLAAGYLKRSRPRPDLAKASLDACLVRRADFLWVYLLRGFAESELGEFEAAEADFQEAWEAWNRHPDAVAAYGLLVNRGVLRLRQARSAQAVDLPWVGPLLPQPGPWWAGAQVAQAWARRKLAEADADLREAIRQQPEHYQAYVNLAQVYEQARQWDRAAEQLDQAVEREPALALLYRERAAVRGHQHRTAAALEDLDRAIAIETDGSPYLAADLVHKARLLFQLGRYPEAATTCAAALAAQPGDAEALLWHAEALLKCGRYREAAAALDRYAQRGTPAGRFYQTRGLVRARLGEPRGAVDDYTRALALDPDAETYVQRGWTYLLAFDAPQLALPDFEEALRRDAADGDAYCGRGNALVQLDRPGRPLADAEQAVRLRPRSSRAWYGAARIYAQWVGRLDARGPRDGPSLERRADCQGRALEFLAEAVRLQPPHRRAAFWHEEVARDRAFDPIRSATAYARLAADSFRQQSAR
jgi:serine/threonine protein kinase/Tfp pilus assembly protein PilF